MFVAKFWQLHNSVPPKPNFTILLLIFQEYFENLHNHELLYKILVSDIDFMFYFKLSENNGYCIKSKSSVQRTGVYNMYDKLLCFLFKITI